jgi:AsmA protein
MRRIILTLSIIFACLVLFFFFLTLALRNWFNPNILIAPLSNQIQQKTGLVLRINGKLSWHIFPTARITVRQLSLQATAPQDATNARIQTLNISLSFWPLITEKKLIVNNVTLDGIDLTLQADSFQALKQNPTLPVTAANKTIISTSTDNTKQSIGFAIKNITINNAILHGALDNVRPGATFYLDSFSVKNLGSSSSVKTIPIAMEARIVDKGNTLPLSLKSDVIFDGRKQSLSTDNLQAHINTLDIQGHLSAQKISSDLQWQGKVTLDDKNVADTMHLLTGTSNLPIKTLHSTFDLTANKKTIDLSTLNLKLNDDTITGSATYDIKQNYVNSVLNADTVHWSTMNVSTPTATDNSTVQSSNTTTPSKATTPLTPKNKRSSLSLNSQLHIQHLLYNNLSLDNISGQLHYAAQVLTLDPITVTVLQGFYHGKITLTTDNASKLTVAGTLSHLDLALLQQYLGAKLSVTGLLDAKGTLSSEGQSQKQRVASLNGNIALVINQGSWTKLNLNNVLGLLNLISSRHTLPTNNGFSSVSGDFAIHNGVANNPNLKLISPLLTAKGNGTVNLVAQTLDYNATLHLDSNVSQQISGSSQWSEQDIPITIKGPLDNPKIELDNTAVIKTKVEKSVHHVLKKVHAFFQFQ